MAGLDIVILGLSITSSWGNGHATTYRALIRGLAGRGHRVLFLERDMPWYAAQRDLAEPPYCEVRLYDGLEQLEDEHTRAGVGEQARSAQAGEPRTDDNGIRGRRPWLHRHPTSDVAHIRAAIHARRRRLTHRAEFLARSGAVELRPVRQ